MSVGQRIVELRKMQNISQLQLARDLGISRQAVSKWENDQSLPDTDKMIQLAQILDTDIEYLSTGRRNMARRPPVVLETVNTVEVEKIVEVPVVKVVEKIVEKPVVEYIEKPVIRKVFRKKYVRNPVEYAIVAFISLLIGVLIGRLL